PGREAELYWIYSPGQTQVFIEYQLIIVCVGGGYMNSSINRVVATAMFLLVFLLAGVIEAHATVRRVPADYPTIQQAINAAVNGDTVLVAPGTYMENINFLGKAIIVTGEEGAQTTIIDGRHLGPVVKFNSGEGPNSVLSRLTIQNGDNANNSNAFGGGISVQFSSPTITQNVITNNTACFGGCGIGIFIGSPVIKENRISGNFEAGCIGPDGAGGIYVIGTSSAQILNNTISSNSYQNGGGIKVV